MSNELFVKAGKSLVNLWQVRVIEVQGNEVTVVWGNGDREQIREGEEIIKWLKSKVVA
jgi:hypothetical protein